MHLSKRSKSILCLLLVLFLALPQSVGIRAEAEEAAEEVSEEVYQEELPEEVPETQEGPSLTLDTEQVELKAGESHTFTVTLNEAAQGMEVHWTSDDPDIAYVEEGTVKALKEGSTVITASLNEEAYVKVNVTVLPEPIEQMTSMIRFEQRSYEVNIGETIVIPYELDGESEVTWSLDDESLAVLHEREDGQVEVEALAGGVVRLTAKTGEGSDTVSLVILDDDKSDYAGLDNTPPLKASSIVTGTYTVTYDQSGARDLAAKLNAYRTDTAQINALVYDYTIEKYAMQRAAETVLSFSHTRPNGESFTTIFSSAYGTSSDTNLNENLLSNGDGSMSTATQILNRVLNNSEQRTRALRSKNRSFGIAHVIYNGIDYWVMLFSDIQVPNNPATSPVNKAQDVSVKIRSGLYDANSMQFVASKSILKVNVGHSASLPSVTGKVKVVLGGKEKSISFTGYTATWKLDDTGERYAFINGAKVVARAHPNNDEKAYLVATVKMNGITKTVKVELKVIQPVTAVTLSPTEAQIDAGKTVKLTAKVLPEDATDKTVTWKSSDTKIATVSSSGVVTGKKGGKCKITVTTNDGGYKKTCDITVIVHAEGIVFDIDQLTMTVGMTDKIVPIFVPADTTNKEVTYTSSPESVVSVDKYGNVKALAVTGSSPAIITVTSKDTPSVKATLPVVIKEKDQVKKPTASFLAEQTYDVPAYDYDEIGMADMLVKGDPIKLETATKDAVIYYTTDGTTPTTASNKYTGMIKYEGGDLTIKAIAVKAPQMLDSEVATFKFEETQISHWEIWEEDLEKLEKDGDVYKIPTGLWASGVDRKVAYTGNKITFPEIRVYYRNHMLVANQDYKISYKNNVNVCPEGSSGCVISYKDDGSYVPAKNTKVAHIIIAGKGNYKGNAYIPFEIEPIAISSENGFEYQDELYASIGTKDIAPLPVITWNGKKLKNKTDYVIAYAKNADGSDVLPDGKIGPDDAESQNTFYAVVSGVKNFTHAEPLFTVPIHVKKDGVLISKTKVKVAAVEYSGETIDPDTLDMTVTIGKETLVKGTDYVIEKVQPEEIKEIGTYTLTLKATDESRYIGTKEVTLKVTGKSLSKMKVYCLGTKVTYTGETFELTDLYKYDPKRPDLSEVTLYDGSTKLVEGQDYSVQVSGHDKGKGTVIFSGMGNYTGTLKKAFTIDARTLSKDDVVIFTTDVYFTKTGARPEVYVFLITDDIDETAYEISEGVYGHYLWPDEDYSLKFFNNKRVYTDSDFREKNAPSVSVIMKGNYKGTFANNHFLITAEDISYFRMETKDIVYAANKKGSQYYVKPVIYDFEGKKLTLDKDYRLTYYYAQDARVNGSSTYNRAYGTPVRATDVPEPGTIIGVKATGMGSYYGTLSGEYKVFKKGQTLASAKVTINYKNGKNKYFDYTGSQVIPTAENLTVTLNKKTLVYGVDYEILSFKNNIKAGKATMVLRGLGEYGGTKNVTFNIGKQTLLLDIRYLLGLLFGD